MSLDTLRQLRRAGGKPEAFVKVVVGKALPPTLASRPDMIAIRPEEQPQLLDWRPVVGLPFSLLVCEGVTDQAERTFDALIAAGGQPYGACWRDGAHSTNETVREILPRMWELLCLS